MDAHEKDELHRVWLMYMNTAGTKESDYWFDVFLSKFIHLMCSCSDEKLVELRLCWKSVSNVIAHQLLANLNQICNEILSLKSNLNQDSEAISAPLQKYLLEGRGWKLLWSLGLLGIKNISCTKELVNLLIVVVPAVLTFPVSPTNMPEYISNKLLSCTHEIKIPPSKGTLFSRSSILLKYRNSNILQRGRRKGRVVTANKMALRQQVAKQKSQAIDPGGSSSDGESFFAAQKLSLLFCKSPSPPTQEDKQTVTDSAPSLLDENIDSLSETSVNDLEMFENFKNYSLSVIDYVKYVLHLLEAIVVMEQSRQLLVSNTSSSQTIEFAMNFLRHNISETGFYKLENWPEAEVKNMRCCLLKLIFSSILVIKNLKSLRSDVNLNTVVTVILTITSDMITSGNLNQNASLQDVEFVYNAVFGTFMLIHHVANTCDDLGQIIYIVRTFLNCDGVCTMCSIMSHLERTSNCENHMVNIFALIKSIVILLKAIRCHQSKQHHSPPHRNFTKHFSHHHTDVLGSKFSHSITHTEPVCCIASLCHIMLKAYSTLTLQNVKKSALKMIRDCGICCCIEPSFISEMLFSSNFDKHDPDLQLLVLSMVEKTFFPQLGLISSSDSVCVICEERQKESKSLTPSASMEYLGAASYNVYEFSFHGCKDSSKWRFLNAYASLLDLNNMHVTMLVTRHLGSLFSSSVRNVKKELFVRCIFPRLIKLVFELLKENPLSDVDKTCMQSFLSFLPQLLSDDCIASVFLQFGGIRVLCDIMSFSDFWSASLQSLKVLILMEIKRHTQNSDISLLYSADSGAGCLSLVTFSDILCKYSKLFLKSINTLSGSLLGGDSNIMGHVKNGIFTDVLKLPASNTVCDTNEESNFQNNLEFLSDLWAICKDIVLRTPVISPLLNRYTISKSYDLFLSLLDLLLYFSGHGNEVFQSYLELVKNLLLVILHYETSAPDSFEIFPGKERFLKIIKLKICDSKLDNMRNMQSLLDTLLLCAVPNSTLVEENTNTLVKGNDATLSCLDKSVSSSDESDEFNELLSYSYDGDTEQSDSVASKSSCEWVQHSHNNSIGHGDIVKLVLELVICFFKEIERQHWVIMATEIVQSVISFCQSSKRNVQVLSEQDISSDLLDGFFEVLVCSKVEYQDLQTAVMDLFTLLSQHTMSSEHLKMFISLCKWPSAPFDILMRSLNSIVDTMPPWPYHAIRFPSAKTRLKIGRKENRKRYSSFLKLYDKYFRKASCVVLNAWSKAAAILPFMLDNFWAPVKTDFSIMMWLMLEKPSKCECMKSSRFMHCREDHSVNKSNSESTLYHLLSVGSEVSLFEMWVNREKGEIAFRTNYYTEDGVVCLAKAVTRDLLKPNSWHHVTVHYSEESRKKSCTTSTIKVLVDGCEKEELVLTFNSISQKNVSQYMLLGHCEQESSLPDGNFYLASCMLFRGAAVTQDIAFYLANLGPSITCISRCLLGERSMFFPSKITSKVLDCGFETNLMSGLCVPSLESLQKNLLLLYSAEKPQVCALYPQPARIIFPVFMPFTTTGNFSIVSQNEWPSQQAPSIERLLFSSIVNTVQKQNLYTAMHQSGGISIFMFLFAKVIEYSSDEETQAITLQILLKILLSNCESCDYFLKISGDSVLQLLLRNKKCSFSLHMLKVLLDYCVSSPLMTAVAWSSKWTIDSHSEAIVTRPLLLSLLLKSVFLSENSPDVVKIYFVRAAKVLLRDNHPCLNFNVQQMKSVQMLETLHYILKDYYILSDRKLPLEVANSIPVIVQKLLHKPMDFKQLWVICNFLLLLHRTANTYICHAQSSFYFLFAKSESGVEMESFRYQVARSSGSALSSIDSSNDIDMSPSAHFAIKKDPLRSVKSMTDLHLYKSGNHKMQRFGSFKCTSRPDLENKVDFLLCSNSDSEENAKTCDNDNSTHVEQFASDDLQPENEVGDQNIPSNTEDLTYCNDIDENKTKTMNSEDEKDADRLEVYLGLLNLLKDIIVHSDDDMKAIILDVIQPEVFLILVYTTNPRICHAVIEIIHTYLQYASEEKIVEFLKIKGFHLLANQLHHLSPDPLIVGTFFNVMFFDRKSAEDFSVYYLSSDVADSLHIMSWIPLIALLPNVALDIGMCNSILSALTHLLSETHSCISVLTSNGLCESLVLLISRLLHSSKNKDYHSCESVEIDAIVLSIFTILRMIASYLFSSKESSDFDGFTSLLHLLSNMEIQCHIQCSPSAACVVCWRDCHCVVLQSALDFIELYNYRQMKDDAKSDFSGDPSLMDIMLSIPDNLNPYSVFLTSVEAVICGSKIEKEMDDSTLSDAQCTIENVERANKELPMTDAIQRFQFFLTSATDFIVFRDIHCLASTKQNLFFQSLYRFVVRVLHTAMENVRETKKTRWAAVVLPAKEVLRQQLNRLLVTTLALHADKDEKFFTLQVLTEHPKFAEMITSVFFSCEKVENFPIFLLDLNIDRVAQTWQQRRIFQSVMMHVNENLKNIDCQFLQDSELIQKLKRNWKESWFEDRQNWLCKQMFTKRKMQKRLDKLAKHISEIAMDVTKKVVDLQSIERKKFMEEVKSLSHEEVSTKDIWLNLIEQFTHEKAIWHFSQSYMHSWELDPTEGPQRIRKRLRRCHLQIEPKYLLPEFKKTLRLNNSVASPFIDLIEPKLSGSSMVINKLHSYEQIEYTCPCKVILSFEEVKGEILIGDHFLHFIGEEKGKSKVITEHWPYYGIKEILPRRYELQNNAFEIFMKNGLTFLVAFHSTSDLENVWKRMENHKLPCVNEISVSSLTQLWRDQSITNFEYLTQLNKLACRSFNDLMQYPVFPYILADYRSHVLDLSDSSSFRNLSKPVAVQNKSREEYYRRAYNSLKDELLTGPWNTSDLPISGPYHYGSHYSNSGTVLHFLVRLLPYTYSLIHYQDNSFDIPDRTFHSVETSWHLVTRDSTSDVKELIPEFFFLPEFLCNQNGFNLGVRQCGEQVNDVILPAWCNNNPRLFIQIHRQALESSYVTNTLNNWIDLVFGYKQTGNAAVSAINVFPPATYFGMDISKLEDPITRQALYAMIKTVGQMPRQLFNSPHPMVSFALSLTNQEENQQQSMPVLDTVIGLRWGDYVGSPAFGKPNLIWRCKQPIPIGNLLALCTNDVFGLQQNVCLLLSHKKQNSTLPSPTYIRSAALISWLHEDGIVRIKFCRDHPPVPLINGNSVDPVCLCASAPDCNELFIAHKSGCIYVYNCDVDSSKFTMTENRLPVQLLGHTRAVTSIYICKTFSIVITSSEDKSCILWDLNKLHYVRTICTHDSAVKLVCVSDTLGDIASVSHTDNGSCLKVHTINGDLVGSITMSEVITALCYSTAPEGTSVNVIATGTSTGSISLWSSWDLRPVREIADAKFTRPITCMTYSVDNQHLLAANVDGVVTVWEKTSKMLINLPRFLLFT